MIVGVNHAVGRLPVVLKNADGTGGLKHWHNQSYCGFATILEPQPGETEIVLTQEEMSTLVVLDTPITLRELVDGLNWGRVHPGQQPIHRHIALPSKLSFLLGAGRTAGPGASLQIGKPAECCESKQHWHHRSDDHRRCWKQIANHHDDHQGRLRCNKLHWHPTILTGLERWDCI